MPIVDHEKREVGFKIVYWGSGLVGKTTNLQWLYVDAGPDRRNKMIALETERERVLFFDFAYDRPLPNGYTCRLHLYCVPGCTFFFESTDLVPAGASGVVFVATCEPERLEAHVQALDDLDRALFVNGLDIDRIPLVLQLNKTDLPGGHEPALVARMLDRWGRPRFRAVATGGEGVVESLRACADAVIDAYVRGDQTHPPHALLRTCRAARHAAARLHDPEVEAALEPEVRARMAEVVDDEPYDIWPRHPGGAADHTARVMHHKLVVWGPAGAELAPLLEAMRARCEPRQRSPLTRHTPWQGGPTRIYFDFAARRTQQPDGSNRSRFHIYAHEGPMGHARDAHIALRGVSGVLLVVDLRAGRILDDLACLDRLLHALVHEWTDPARLPMAVLFIHADAHKAVDAGRVARLLGLQDRPADHADGRGDALAPTAMLRVLRAVVRQAKAGETPERRKAKIEPDAATRRAGQRLARDADLRAGLPTHVVAALGTAPDARV